MAKDKRRLRNWAQYNRGLIDRGRIELWIDRTAADNWYDQPPPGLRRTRGRPRRYSDTAIRLCLTLKTLYHLPLRAAQGLCCSVMALLHLSLPVPHFSVLCRRAARLGLAASQGWKSEEPPACVLAIDSTGLKVYGEGEWKVRRYGYTRRRTWMKLHLALNVESQKLHVALLSTNGVDDGSAALQLLDLLGEESSPRVLIGDRGYDQHKLRSRLHRQGISQLIMPGSRAVASSGGVDFLRQRDEALSALAAHGRECWSRMSGYSRRSVVETAMYRYKQLIGSVLRARLGATQQTEIAIGCEVLNRMLDLAKPISNNSGP